MKNIIHLTINLSVGSNIESKYCIIEMNESKESIIDSLLEDIYKYKTLSFKSDPDKIRDGKKTVYLIKTDRIISVDIS